MLQRIGLTIAVGLAVISCGTNDNSRSANDPTGMYVQEHSFKVINSETGKEIGIRSVRDTIFILPKGSHYEVSNHKWSLNDYDKQGWQNMKHSDDRPLPTYLGNFEADDASLNSIPTGLVESLYFDLQKHVVYKDKARAKGFTRVD